MPCQLPWRERVNDAVPCQLPWRAPFTPSVIDIMKAMKMCSSASSIPLLSLRLSASRLTELHLLLQCCNVLIEMLSTSIYCPLWQLSLQVWSNLMAKGSKWHNLWALAWEASCSLGAWMVRRAFLYIHIEALRNLSSYKAVSLKETKLPMSNFPNWHYSWKKLSGKVMTTFSIAQLLMYLWQGYDYMYIVLVCC